MLKLNLLTARKNEHAYTATSVNEIEFWEYYLNLLNVTQGMNKLNSKEIMVMSYVLAGDHNKSYFRGPEATQLKADLRMKKSDLSKIKSSLVSKEYLIETGATRGDALAVRAIRTFQIYVKHQLRLDKLPVLNFMFTFNINDTTED